MASKFQFDSIKRIDKLAKRDQDDLVSDLIHALVQARSVDDVVTFLQDLLTKNELRVLAKRLGIAKLLLKGMTYEEIEQKLHVSHGTVAKIAAWLSQSGEGFRRIIQRLPRQTTEKSWQDYSDWDKLKRKYPMYFWPELLLEELIKQANTRQKKRLQNLIDGVENKAELHKRIEKLLHS